MTSNRIYIAVAALVLFALGWVWLRPYPMPDASEIVPEPLPTAPSLETDGLLERILSKNLWSRERSPLAPTINQPTTVAVTPPAPSPQITRWRLLGVSHEGTRKLAVVAVGDQTLETATVYFPGDILPGGERLVEVLPFGIQLEESGSYENRYLFGKE